MGKVLFLGLLISASSVMAADLTHVSCMQCRDVYQHPEDYGNFAYNSVFGDDATVSIADGDIMKVEGPNGQWAVVDLNFVLEQTGLSLNITFLSYAVSLPNGQIQMVTQDPRGKVTVRYAFILSPDLKVGDGTPPPPTAPLTQQQAEDYRAQLPQTSSGGGPVGTPCCQSGEFYWYYDMPEFRIQTLNKE